MMRIDGRVPLATPIVQGANCDASGAEPATTGDCTRELTRKQPQVGQDLSTFTKDLTCYTLYSV